MLKSRTTPISNGLPPMRWLRVMSFQQLHRDEKMVLTLIDVMIVQMLDGFRRGGTGFAT